MKRALVALLLLCAGCDGHPAAPVPASAPASAAKSAAPEVTAPMPADQAKLLGLIAAANADPKNTTAFTAFCTAFEAMPGFDGWTGKVSDAQTSTVNGAIDVTFDMGRHLHLEPVVQKDDPLYAAVERLAIGDSVRISGHFSHNDGSSECTYYLSSFAVGLTKVD